jgi:transcriptional regulator with XRE-family HTH domain
MKERTLQGFGKRLAEIRQSRPMTQAELGAAVGVSKRVIAYYEQQDAQPPGAMLVDLARALHVSSDELLGLKPVKEKKSLKTARLLKRLQNVERLPAADQRTVLKMIEGLLERNGRLDRQASNERGNARSRASHRTAVPARRAPSR